MQFPTRPEIEQLKALYMGKKIELIQMVDDPLPIEPGTKGIVKNVDDLGQLEVDWENNRTLRVALYAGDKVNIIS